MLRRIAASYRTALVLGVVALVLHLRWYTVDEEAGGEVVSGFGAALVVLDVVAERVVAVAVVVLGTLLNSYGPLVARLFSLR